MMSVIPERRQLDDVSGYTERPRVASASAREPLRGGGDAEQSRRASGPGAG